LEDKVIHISVKVFYDLGDDVTSLRSQSQVFCGLIAATKKRQSMSEAIEWSFENQIVISFEVL